MKIGEPSIDQNLAQPSISLFTSPKKSLDYIAGIKL